MAAAAQREAVDMTASELFMKRIVVPTESGCEWRRLLAKPDLHWKPDKSAMSAAASWEAAGNHLPIELSAALTASKDPDLANLDLLLAVPEWEVELPGGLTTSHTDVLAWHAMFVALSPWPWRRRVTRNVDRRSVRNGRLFRLGKPNG